MQASDVGGNEKIEHTGAPGDGVTGASEAFEFPPKDNPWGESHGLEEGRIAGERFAEQHRLALAEKAAQGADAVSQARLESDLVKRAKALHALEAFNFPESKLVTANGMPMMRPATSEVNIMHAIKVMCGESAPYFDTFRGRIVDPGTKNESGKSALIDDKYPVGKWAEAMVKLQLASPSLSMIKSSMRDLALQTSRNSLIESFNARIPEWDGTPRLRTYLVELLECRDTELTRDVAEYFWLSLYNRINSPGCMAAASIALIGGQQAGKSHFGRLLCRIIMQDKDANTVPIDLANKDQTGFLRNITGQSIIANAAEMVGFKSGDMNRIKQFVENPADTFDYKFEGSFKQPRQWIIIMDGNSYEGLQRDETGNRRFYPIFVGQIEDEGGQPAWNENFEIEYDGLEDSVWQIMAECREWIERKGQDGYIDMASAIGRGIKEFSLSEMNSGRGTIQTSQDDFMARALLKAHKSARHIEKEGRNCVFIANADITAAMQEVGVRDPNPRYYQQQYMPLGGKKIAVNGMRGCYFQKYGNPADMDMEFSEKFGMSEF